MTKAWTYFWCDRRARPQALGGGLASSDFGAGWMTAPEAAGPEAVAKGIRDALGRPCAHVILIPAQPPQMFEVLPGGELAVEKLLHIPPTATVEMFVEEPEVIDGRS